MPLDSHFELSLELTNLIPFKVSDVVNFARALQKSGSDLVAEEDLVLIFGRNKLEEQFESSFKTVIRESTKQTILSKALDIIIEGGAGPSTQQALKQRERFSTIVQLSMLTWIHERQSLATALISAMRRRIQGALAGAEVASIPGESALVGFLKSCEEQTSAFPWQWWFDAVLLKLGHQDVGIRECKLSLSVLQGSLDMLTAVQSFPEDRIVFIQSHTGVVTMVVWAHCLLGLEVSVRTPSGTVAFGEPNAKVIIDITNDLSNEPSISLLDASHEIILDIRSEDDFEDIDSEFKYPAKGYGTRLLRSISNYEEVVSGMAHLTAAIGWNFAKRLQVVSSPAMILAPPRLQALESLKPLLAPDPETDNIIEPRTPQKHKPISDNDTALKMAESFLFDGMEMDRDLVEEYISKVRQAKSIDDLNIPSTIKNTLWRRDREIARRLALVMVSLGAVNDLSACDQWRLGDIGCVGNARKAKYLDHDKWAGSSLIP